MYQLKIAVRSLFFRKSQYRSLFMVCMFGVAVSLTAIFVSTGMIRAMSEKARVYYGGDLTFMLSTDGSLWFDRRDEVLEKVRSVFPDGATVSLRIAQDGRSAMYYFEGTQTLTQTINGVDFDAEAPLFELMNFSSGSYSGMRGTNGILISEAIASMMGAKVGDSITLMVEDNNDMKNTVDVVVSGIFHDSSAFGMYTSYMDVEFLRESFARPENSANRICVTFPDGQPSWREIEGYHEALAGLFDMYPLTDDKDDFLDARKDYVEPIAVLVPLSANLTDVKIMQKAMGAVVSFIVVMLVVIIVAGIGSSYRILVIKRLNEIGIYMALGMKKTAIAATLLFEALVLMVSGVLCSLALSALLCFVLSRFSFSFIPAFDIFLVKGNLSPSVDVVMSVAVVAVVIVCTLLAVLYSAWKSIRLLPVRALATVE